MKVGDYAEGKDNCNLFLALCTEHPRPTRRTRCGTATVRWQPLLAGGH
eukprot:gene5957-biopygen14851